MAPTTPLSVVRGRERCGKPARVLLTTLALLAYGCAAQRVTVPLIPPLLPAPKPPIFWSESFDALQPDRWREVEVRGHTRYEAVELEGRRCLKAESQTAASILLHAIQFDSDAYEWLSWDWRVDRLVEGEALHRKDGSDAAARLYVYFESGGLPWQKRNLDYVWSASLPVGTILNSAYSSTSKIIVVESGAASLGQWRSVTRNIRDDYKRAFGHSPSDVIAIGLMTDTDNTSGEALAYFDDLHVDRHSPQDPSR